MFKFCGGIAVAIAVMATPVQAASVSIELDTHITGYDLGDTSLATLALSEILGGVQFTLTNTGTTAGADSFLSRLYLAFDGNATDTSFDYVSGVLVAAYGTSSTARTEPGNTAFNIRLDWSTSNRNGGLYRLNVGEETVFNILGVSLDTLLDNSGFDPFAMAHFQGLDVPPGATDSTHYGTTALSMPLPGGLLLMATGLAGLGARLSRRG